MNSPDSRLVLREIPVALWFFGLIFAGVGVLMIYAGGPYPVMSLLFIGIGLCIVLFASILTVTADRVVRILKFESRSILRHIKIRLHR
jgi:Mg/Co/Ni transporter MgtE